MDEVDFTILAATSVLGDLVEKCPPAEACRDAFDRMSKATVQMCMSTTGFSSSTSQGLNSRQHKPKATTANPSPDYFIGNGAGKSYGRGNGRVKPTFDMGLNDLLGPIPRTGAVTPGNITPGGNVKNEFEFDTVSNSLQNPNPQQQTQSQQSTSPATSYAISPPLSSLDTSSIDPSLLPSPTANFSVPQQQQFQYNPDLTFSNLSMDFMGNGAGNGNIGINSWDGTADWGTGGGGDIGMGLGWEGTDHDFSEGGNGGLPDLFEGFFFGGTGNF